MTKESKKTFLPHFEQASPPPSAMSEDLESHQQQTPPSNRETTFYGAAYNLLSTFFKYGFAPTIDASNFYKGCSVNNGVFNFTLIPHPDDKYRASDVNECVANFISEIVKVVQIEELNISLFHTAAPYENGLILKTTSPTDLMDLLNSLLKPYEITLGVCFNPVADFRPDAEPVSFAMSPLYSLEHVRAVYLHAQGIDCTHLGLGLQLSH